MNFVMVSIITVMELLMRGAAAIPEIIVHAVRTKESVLKESKFAPMGFGEDVKARCLQKMKYVTKRIMIVTARLMKGMCVKNLRHSSG
jgi:hypothetical protein